MVFLLELTILRSQLLFFWASQFFTLWFLFWFFLSFINWSLFFKLIVWRFNLREFLTCLLAFRCIWLPQKSILLNFNGIDKSLCSWLLFDRFENTFGFFRVQITSLNFMDFIWHCLIITLIVELRVENRNLNTTLNLTFAIRIQVSFKEWNRKRTFWKRLVLILIWFQGSLLLVVRRWIS